MGKDYYKILGVPKDADSAAIKKAYRQLAMKWHPDKNQDKVEEAQAKFQEISEAYDVLSDPEKRKIFDQFGEEGLKSGVGGRGGYSFNFGNAQDIFSQFFTMFGDGMGGATFSFGPGMDGFGGMFGGGGGRRAGPRAPPSVEIPVQVTLELLFTGGEKKLKVFRKRNRKEEEHFLTINIKPGWKSGTKITFDGEGDEYEGGYQDIIFIIQEKPHDIFKRVGDDLVLDEIVSLRDALCGFSLTKKGIDGKMVTLTVDTVLGIGEDKRIRGEGMPRKGGGRGDLVFKFSIAFPTGLTNAQKAQLKEILPA